eukprot:5290765-Prymnesium_polylepis.1
MATAGSDGKLSSGHRARRRAAWSSLQTSDALDYRQSSRWLAVRKEEDRTQLARRSRPPPWAPSLGRAHSCSHSSFWVCASRPPPSSAVLTRTGR